MSPLEIYLQEAHAIHASGAGVAETSYYPALSNLLNTVGKTLKPSVKCFIHLQNKGAGIPDGGFFVAQQYAQANDTPLRGQIPERGALEVKSPREDLQTLATSEQVNKYVARYQQVLVTNLRDFLLVVQDANGNAVFLESYSLASSANEFWQLARHPKKFVEQHAERFADYLKRVLLHPAPLTEPKDVAWFLASYAREARVRVEQSDLPALSALRSALEEALGLTFQGAKGEHFFRSTLVQTLFYGVFSAWVLWHNKHPHTTTPFDWRLSEYELQIPVLQSLFNQLAAPNKLKPLDLMEVLDWTGTVLNQVDRDAFFTKFDRKDAIQYFYEPFLENFDPALRKDYGVWYTPPEIIEYMVARVDTVLRDELNIADGLADPNVYILDPACGTGGYLVKVLNRIANTLHDQGGDALVAHQLKRAAMERVFGFEILPAPFVVAHLQLGLLLQALGAPLSEAQHERAGVYLTNALTGWEPPDAEAKKQIAQLAMSFPELEAERDAAQEVKQSNKILVILGNPPYNAFAGVSPEEEKGLVDVYKQGLRATWGIKKFNLDDLYVRFFRLAERYIGEQHTQGVVCYISNFSYLSDPSFVVMRQRILDEFDGVWIDCLNGDSRETGKLTPEGKPDPSIFSTKQNREGIRVGTAIGLFVRRNAQPKTSFVQYREFWGVKKRADLIASLDSQTIDVDYERAEPIENNRFSFRPSSVESNYLAWARLTDLCAVPPFQGLSEDRRKALIDIDKDKLTKQIGDYFDLEIPWAEYKRLGGVLSETYVDFPAKQVREAAFKTEKFNAHSIRRYTIRPFDTQFCYYTSFRPIWRRNRPEFFQQAWSGNKFIVSRFNQSKTDEGIPLGFISTLSDYHYLAPNAVAFPFQLRITNKLEKSTQMDFLQLADPKHLEIIANLSLTARAYLAALDIPNPDKDEEAAGLIWYHALAIGYAPAYLSENADGIRQDFPRIPLPNSRELLYASASLGRQLAALLDTEQPVKGVTSGAIRPELKLIAVISSVGGTGALNPDHGDLDVTVGWGHTGKEGVTMPGKGKLVQRELLPAERAAHSEVFGARTNDIYLSDRAFWKNIPIPVWGYTIGGYQVIKKWLSYREQELLGRGLTLDETREVTNMARRIAALVLLQPELDANYQTIKNATYAFQT